MEAGIEAGGEAGTQAPLRWRSERAGDRELEWAGQPSQGRNRWLTRWM
jgi:hypothetical protein